MEITSWAAPEMNIAINLNNVRKILEKVKGPTVYP